jgi:hypothetical protein
MRFKRNVSATNFKQLTVSILNKNTLKNHLLNLFTTYKLVEKDFLALPGKEYSCELTSTSGSKK